MKKRASRREMLQWTGVGAAGLLLGPSIVACGDDAEDGGGGGSADARSSDGGPGAGMARQDAGIDPGSFAPNEPWWLQGNYAPLTDELEAMDLEVEGAIPPELDGLYLRNGSNARGGDNGHWFIGNGMVHGVRISGGEALWYRNRWVQTPLLDRAPDAGTPVGPPALTDTASNVSVVHHAGKLLSLGEVGLPYELAIDDLSTIGAYDFAGKLMTNMTAHPKLDPVTGEMLMFGYNFLPPYLTYHQVDASGALVRSEEIELPAGPMMHDFAITERNVVFMDLPILFDLDLAIGGSAFPFKWSDSHTARLGVMPRDGGNADVRWFEIDPCYVFHVMNAHEVPGEEGVIALEGVRYERLWAEGADDFDALPQLHRFRIDTQTGAVALEQLDDRTVEFPQLDWRRTGRPYRYGYGLWLPGSPQSPSGARNDILKYDHQAGSVQVHALAEGQRADEAIFVPASADAGEDEGYLLSYVYDAADDRSHVLILDASNLEAAPLARIRLPGRIPFGFHGTWVPA